MRPIVSYEDIASAPAYSQAPPAKKRKTNHKNKRNRNRQEEELTHDEIWDDSALIDAWTAANEEYAAHHGDDKSWKDECGASLNATRHPPDDKTDIDAEPASQPLLNVNFEPTVSQDEAFQRTMSAMYRAGYWTAVYHHKRRLEEEEEGEEEQVEVEENLVSTQR